MDVILSGAFFFFSKYALFKAESCMNIFKSKADSKDSHERSNSCFDGGSISLSCHSATAYGIKVVCIRPIRNW
jgi:hypothetical protein